MALCLKQRTVTDLHALQAHDRDDNRTSITIICGLAFGHDGECNVGRGCERNTSCVRGYGHSGVCMVPRGR